MKSLISAIRKFLFEADYTHSGGRLGDAEMVKFAMDKGFEGDPQLAHYFSTAQAAVAYLKRLGIEVKDETGQDIAELYSPTKKITESDEPETTLASVIQTLVDGLGIPFDNEDQVFYGDVEVRDVTDLLSGFDVGEANREYVRLKKDQVNVQIYPHEGQIHVWSDDRDEAVECELDPLKPDGRQVCQPSDAQPIPPKP